MDNVKERPPLVLSRSAHPISREAIDDNALKVLYRLSSLGYEAYLVGGGVRDLFLEKKPKDYDVGTDARPSRVKKIFRNSRVIGRRFRIAHVFFGDGGIVEVATFRRGNQVSIETRKGMIQRDNEYGTAQEDAFRRDLTINGLFYDIKSFSVIDYVGGVRDLNDRIVRTIADPDASFAEDPVRMIRAQRHATRARFEIEANTLAAIERHRSDIHLANPSRLLEEMLKDLRGGSSKAYFALLLNTRLFDCLLPTLAQQLRNWGEDHPFWNRMGALDKNIGDGAEYSPPVLLSLLLHTVLLPDEQLWLGERNNPSNAWSHILSNLEDATRCVRIAKRDVERMAQILIAYRKLRLALQQRKLSTALTKKSYVPEALDFLEVDLASRGEPTGRVREWRQRALDLKAAGRVEVEAKPASQDGRAEETESHRPRRRGGRSGRSRRRGRKRRRQKRQT